MTLLYSYSYVIVPVSDNRMFMVYIVFGLDNFSNHDIFTVS